MDTKPRVPLDKLVKTYLKIRERRLELKAQFDEQDAPLTTQLEAVKGALLEHCKQHDVDSVKTSEGLFYRTVKQSYWTSDWEHLHSFIVEHAEPSLLDRRINQKNMKQFLEEHPELLPKGLNSNSEYIISIRRNKK